MYEHSFQKAPKFPPPTKPPKTSVLGMANVPMVSVKKQAPNEQKGQRSTPKVEVSKESSNQGHADMGTDLDEFGDLNCWVLGAGVGDPGTPTWTQDAGHLQQRLGWMGLNYRQPQ